MRSRTSSCAGVAERATDEGSHAASWYFARAAGPAVSIAPRGFVGDDVAAKEVAP